jgi:PAS domain S-box-containing protein
VYNAVPVTDSLQQRLADAQRRAEVQYVVSQVLSTATTTNEALAALLPALAEALQWEYAAVWLVDGDSLRCGDTWSTGDAELLDFVDASRRSQFTVGRGLPGRCWAGGEAVWLSGVQRDATLPRVSYARAAGLHGGMAFPVVTNHGTVGVLEGFTREKEQISDELLRLMQAIGRQVGQFLDRCAAEERLQENEARYAAIIQGSLDAIVAMDGEGRVTEFNAAAERLFGYARDETIGHDMASLIIPEHLREAHRAGLRRLRESGVPRLLERRLELTGCRRDGEQFPVELTITRFAGARGEFVGFLRDITERQRHTREREALLAREQQALRDLSTATRLKDDFLAALSHELRTPLNAILGWAQMLEGGLLDAGKAAAALATIRRNAEVQHQLVNDMLDVSAFVAGHIRLMMEPVVLMQPVKAAVDALGPAAAAKNVRINVLVPDVVITGDATRLQQVFWNLLGNAVKFTPEGGTIDVTATPDGDSVGIVVRDTGAGIAADFLPFVFDRFRQGGQGVGGVGLGLAIVKHIVDGHGGTVAAASHGPGQGAIFTVRLPLNRQFVDS